MDIQLTKPTRKKLILLALALPIVALIPFRHRINFSSTTRTTPRTLPDAPFAPQLPNFQQSTSKPKPALTSITEQESLLINEVIAGAFATIIKSWELANVSYRMLKRSESSEELVATLGPMDIATQSLVHNYICEHLRSKVSPERYAIIATSALQRAASLYNNQVYSQISFHLTDNTTNSATAYDSITLDYAAASDQFNPETIGLSRAPLPHETEALRSRLDTALFKARKDSLLPQSGPLSTGVLQDRYGHLFQLRELE